MKKLILLFLIISLSLSLITVKADSTQQVKVSIDGKEVNFPDAKPHINSDGRTIVPVRFIAENMGCTVDWEGQNKIVTISKDGIRIRLEIGQSWAIVNDAKGDRKDEFDTRAELITNNGETRTFVPLRFISETLGTTVQWDEPTRTVSIYSPEYLKSHPIMVPEPEKMPETKPEPKPVPETGTKPKSTPDRDRDTTNPTTPSPAHSIIGKPYYVNNITEADLGRYERLKGLLQYDDMISISGDPNGEGDLGYLSVAYGWYNPKRDQVVGYINAQARESHKQFNIEIGRYGEKELKRLREVIDIAILGTQEYKDFVYNTILSCKDGFAGGKVDYTDGSYFFVYYNNEEYAKDIWGEEAFNVVVWR